MLFLWVIDRTNADYDEDAGHVIAAETEAQVRDFASRASSEAAAVAWMRPDESNVRKIGTALPSIDAGIVFTDYVNS